MGRADRAMPSVRPPAALPLLLALLAITGAQANEAGDGKGAGADSFVLTLDSDNFERYVPSRSAGVLVNFFMPWCKHSKQMTLDYELLGHTFQRVRYVEIAKVNCENDKPLCEKYGVKGYPTLKWFPPGSLEGEDYLGGRSSQELVRFVNSRAGLQARPKQLPSKIRAVDPVELSAAVADESMDTVVQFFIPQDEVCAHFSGEYDILATAMSAEDHVSLLTADVAAFPELVTEYGVKTVPLVKLFRRNGQGVVTYSGKYTVGALLPWLNGYADTARLLTGVTNSSVGGVEVMDTLAERLVRAPPKAWPAIMQSMQETAEKLQGQPRAFADYYMEAAAELTSPGGLDTLTAKRLELNAQMVAEKAPERRLAVLAQRNVIASIQGRAQKAGLEPLHVPSSPPPVGSRTSTGGVSSVDHNSDDTMEEEGAAAASEPHTVKPPKKRKRRPSEARDTSRDEL